MRWNLVRALVWSGAVLWFALCGALSALCSAVCSGVRCVVLHCAPCSVVWALRSAPCALCAACSAPRVLCVGRSRLAPALRPASGAWCPLRCNLGSLWVFFGGLSRISASKRSAGFVYSGTLVCCFVKNLSYKCFQTFWYFNYDFVFGGSGKRSASP